MPSKSGKGHTNYAVTQKTLGTKKNEKFCVFHDVVYPSPIFLSSIQFFAVSQEQQITITHRKYRTVVLFIQTKLPMKKNYESTERKVLQAELWKLCVVDRS